MPTVWHRPANDFTVVNHLNPACATFRHAIEEQRDLQKPLRSQCKNRIPLFHRFDRLPLHPLPLFISNFNECHADLIKVVLFLNQGLLKYCSHSHRECYILFTWLPNCLQRVTPFFNSFLPRKLSTKQPVMWTIHRVKTHSLPCNLCVFAALLWYHSSLEVFVEVEVL